MEVHPNVILSLIHKQYLTDDVKKINDLVTFLTHHELDSAEDFIKRENLHEALKTRFPELVKIKPPELKGETAITQITQKMSNKVYQKMRNQSGLSMEEWNKSVREYGCSLFANEMLDQFGGTIKVTRFKSMRNFDENENHTNEINEPDHKKSKYSTPSSSSSSNSISEDEKDSSPSINQSSSSFSL